MAAANAALRVNVLPVFDEFMSNAPFLVRFRFDFGVARSRLLLWNDGCYCVLRRCSSLLNANGATKVPEMTTRKKVSIFAHSLGSTALKP